MTRKLNAPIMLAAGGTGGHVFPAQALAAELDRRGRAVDIVTDRRGDDYSGQFPGRTVHQITSATPSGRGLMGKAAAVINIALGTLQARRLIRQVAPAAVVGFGGYPSLPTMLAAITLSVPRAIHEQNAVLGRVNRLIASRMDAIATSFPVTQGLPEKDAQPQLVTGNPVRDDVQALANQAYNAPKIDGPFELLIFGGSQGARKFSQVIPAALLALPAALRRRLEVVQQCRPEDLDAVREVYTKADIRAETAVFFDDMPARLATAHLVIARSGAGTVSELAMAGRPSILVPYAHATDDHQSRNAEVLSSAGGAWVLPEADLAVPVLTEHLAKLMNQPESLAEAAKAAKGRAQPNAAAQLAELVLALADHDENGRAAA
ncbi:MAG: undecaprenyldiphospho-muramoylpentapeptide beta-N-acetylglucosaminyltransferase [Rhodospirillaceae bacterium]|jgi:UDP-N-acetylglucosamine--N-acetylmuramyl-(pentapeptide) pyrophosphoryl-undecaprenol N-acetylglucosamine transferase|nr:undecaprenyldiphospho-muramoylpentapeptide beta-N-acetylglucosaminyltransferase [Rhodospirillaceae bacterium]MBT4046409.1 undecaprenyldiphospho-muramoylpentapeptide beta-N-acetylglucosaminyltransferase [Rhodospirillaceae bacterium]MBT4690541.1 undecaprenyldiphospho-muramoylpentapeptide beta-N-acetylglucosaminyltransferase [Rhodospirillaceae bacterium]MBT5083898.1 undecaprenyldiphospho-muramoylpentapeptide beta-N-acetylglucosaminyltransferase [Rhodospirillaceae bacterium]MBT5526658.1 undecapr